jgi:SAM-dependent methyltransferase
MTDLYYRKTVVSQVATALSITARRKMVDLFFEAFPPTKSLKVLDLGVTSEKDPTANFLERLYPNRENLTCAGIQDASWFEEAYPGLRFVQIKPGPLPFKDREFDVVYSNAVVEHVGSRQEQAAFIAEALRVARAFFITTPNRWFPVETHTHVPLLHYLPQDMFRYLLRLIGENFYSEEKNLNLLARHDLRTIFPENVFPEIRYIWTGGFPSNVVAYGSSHIDSGAKIK